MSDHNCHKCGGEIVGKPLIHKEETEDGEERVYAFCDGSCRSAWLAQELRREPSPESTAPAPRVLPPRPGRPYKPVHWPGKGPYDYIKDKKKKRRPPRRGLRPSLAIRKHR